MAQAARIAEEAAGAATADANWRGRGAVGGGAAPGAMCGSGYRCPGKAPDRFEVPRTADGGRRVEGGEKWEKWER